MSAANGCGMSTNNTIHEALCKCGGTGAFAKWDSGSML